MNVSSSGVSGVRIADQSSGKKIDRGIMSGSQVSRNVERSGRGTS
jgi:hypothetical protein